MKIAIVGSGIAGLTSAWLLDGDHDVTLFEKNEVLGGHALTVRFEVNGDQVFANPAAGYITPNIYPSFIRLLKILKVELMDIPASVTVYSRSLGHAAMLTPCLSVHRLAKVLHPASLRRLLELQGVLLAARKFDLHDDWMTTLEEFMDQQHVSEFVRNEIIYPWMSAVGEVTMEDIKGFSARAALKYPVHAQFGLHGFHLHELVGGGLTLTSSRCLIRFEQRRSKPGMGSRPLNVRGRSVFSDRFIQCKTSLRSCGFCIAGASDKTDHRHTCRCKRAGEHSL
jgi:predicted NAD/FAD-binding protein